MYQTGKNLCNITRQAREVTIVNGIKFVENPDGSVEVYGTPTDTTIDTNYFLFYNSYRFPFDVILSAAPSGSSFSTYYYAGSAGAWYQEKTVTANTNITIYIKYKAGVSANGEIWRPMIRPATISDSTYEQASLSNQAITDKIIDGTLYTYACGRVYVMGKRILKFKYLFSNQTRAVMPFTYADQSFAYGLALIYTKMGTMSDTGEKIVRTDWHSIYGSIEEQDIETITQEIDPENDNYVIMTVAFKATGGWGNAFILYPSSFRLYQLNQNEY